MFTWGVLKRDDTNFVLYTIVTRNNMFGNLGRETPISCDFRKYVQKHCKSPCCVHSEIRKYDVDYIVSYMVDLWVKRDKNIRLKKEIISVKNIILSKNYFVVSIFHELPEHIMKKWYSSYVYFHEKLKAKSLLSDLFSYKLLKGRLNQTKFSHRISFNIFILI